MTAMGVQDRYDSDNYYSYSHHHNNFGYWLLIAHVTTLGNLKNIWLIFATLEGSVIVLLLQMSKRRLQRV